MALLPLIQAPNPIFSKKAEPVVEVTDDIRQIADDMLETLAVEQAVGLGANMVGVLKQIIVVDIFENEISKPLCMINPDIYWTSDTQQEIDEASLCFRGISAKIKRPNKIKVRFLDRDGTQQDEEFSDYLAQVIQHEVDYLHGKTFLDHLSKLKRDILLKKMIKYNKMKPCCAPGSHCQH